MYNVDGDDIITLEEMTRLFENKELGVNLYEDLQIFKGVWNNINYCLFQYTQIAQNTNVYTAREDPTKHRMFLLYIQLT